MVDMSISVTTCSDDIMNGGIDGNCSRTVGSICPVTCNANFVSKVAKVTCTSFGKWSPETVCKRKLNTSFEKFLLFSFLPSPYLVMYPCFVLVLLHQIFLPKLILSVFSMLFWNCLLVWWIWQFYLVKREDYSFDFLSLCYNSYCNF